jgi:uncharacterized protein YndB with AHSA1/START domain
MQKDITRKWFFETTPDIVWDYLTKPELLAQWLMENNFQLVHGYHFQFKGQSDDGCGYASAAYCQVLEIVPHKQLSYSWNSEEGNGDMAFTSLVTWTIVPKNNGTELQLCHSGFKKTEDYMAHDAGWNKCGEKIIEQLNVLKNSGAKV